MYSSSYQEYLKTEHWQKLREEKFKSVGRKCSLCNCNKNLHVHHINYRTPLTACVIYDLQVMCAWCHSHFHGKKMPQEKKPKQFPHPWQFYPYAKFKSRSKWQCAKWVRSKSGQNVRLKIQISKNKRINPQTKEEKRAAERIRLIKLEGKNSNTHCIIFPK